MFTADTRGASPICAGRGIRLHLVARRFRCDEPLCCQRIFAERFDHGVVTSRSRRTARLDCIVHHLGLALGGRPGASFAKRLMLPVSNDTLLRLVRRRSQRPVETLRVVGIDDWAFRRNHRYGSIVCDLERRPIVTLLLDRERATVEARLAAHPGIEVVSRDRGGGYGEAAAKALPRAVQVADRWHLMENASAAFLDAVRKSMRPIRAAIGATVINPALRSARVWAAGSALFKRPDREWALIAPLLPGPRPVGRPRTTDLREVMNAIWLRAVVRGRFCLKNSRTDQPCSATFTTGATAVSCAGSTITLSSLPVIWKAARRAPLRA